MIRIRRVASGIPFSSRIPFFRLYEVELIPNSRTGKARRFMTRSPISVLEPLLGIGDAWSFVNEANRQWDVGNRGWAVEYKQED